MKAADSIAFVGILLRFSDNAPTCSLHRSFSPLSLSNKLSACSSVVSALERLNFSSSASLVFC